MRAPSMGRLDNASFISSHWLISGWSLKNFRARLNKMTSYRLLYDVEEAVGSDDDMVVAIDWDPTNVRRVYAGTDRGKIYCSSDRGESWELVPVTVPAIAVGALIVGPPSN